MLLGHTGACTGVSFMREEGTLLVSTSANGQIIGWDALSGAKVYSVREPDTTVCCQLAVNEGALAVGCASGAVLLMDRLSGVRRAALAAETEEVRTPCAHCIVSLCVRVSGVRACVCASAFLHALCVGCRTYAAADVGRAGRGCDATCAAGRARACVRA